MNEFSYPNNNCNNKPINCNHRNIIICRCFKWSCSHQGCGNNSWSGQRCRGSYANSFYGNQNGYGFMNGSQGSYSGFGEYYVPVSSNCQSYYPLEDFYED